MPTYDIGPCECCGDGGITLCDCTLPETVNAAITLTSGSCTVFDAINITLTYAAASGTTPEGWWGQSSVNGGDEMALLLFCCLDRWLLAMWCSAGTAPTTTDTSNMCTGSSGFQFDEAADSTACDPLDLDFAGLSLGTPCCSVFTPGTYSVNVTA